MNSLITGPPLGDTAVEFLFTEFCLKSSMQNYVSNAIKKKKKPNKHNNNEYILPISYI